MDNIDWLVASRELLIGAIVLVTGLVIVLARHFLAKSRQKDDKEDRERRERVEALTDGINDPDAIKRATQIPGLLKLERAEDSSELGPGPRTWLLYLLLIIIMSIVVGAILVIR